MPGEVRALLEAVLPESAVQDRAICVLKVLANYQDYELRMIFFCKSHLLAK